MPMSGSRNSCTACVPGSVPSNRASGRRVSPRRSTTTWRCPIALAEVHHARAEGNRALDAGDHEGALANAGAIRAMMGILGCDPLDERWESRDETSAALAAVDVLVQCRAGAAPAGARAA